MRHSPVDKRSKRYAPRQCLSDTGHKDAEVKDVPELPFTARPLKDCLNNLRMSALQAKYGLLDEV